MYKFANNRVDAVAGDMIEINEHDRTAPLVIALFFKNSCIFSFTYKFAKNRVDAVAGDMVKIAQTSHN